MSSAYGSTRRIAVYGCVTPEEWDEWLSLFANRNEAAEEYADLICRNGPQWSGYKPFNEAILRRWSMAGLRYIKERAWKIATQDL
jgi:hypothetical protein